MTMYKDKPQMSLTDNLCSTLRRFTIRRRSKLKIPLLLVILTIIYILFRHKGHTEAEIMQYRLERYLRYQARYTQKAFLVDHLL